MPRNDEFFNEVYSIDQANNAYMIEVALDRYTDIFSEWDPAPFKRRELDPDLQFYLETSADEIPARYAIEVCFTLPPATRNDPMEQDVRVGLRNSVDFKLYLLRKEIRLINIRTLQYVMAGLGTLLVARLVSEPAELNLVTAVLTEGLFIGGWVFLWEAVSLFFFSNRDLYNRYRTYKRLRRSQVIFKETEPRADGAQDP
ncbi:hypothetical protein IQ254_25790 [Nodosilinea sp. LEGE 07088]|uniref:hypothetical protein n=1 Tax=Nodosilinea sp. LEGE 07088 TaxID=2777968 RepID=UPI0018805164|nr:hypothetical protein [Nodosilinea sp. LEGE 07088]MBE9140571.1 hypothetical protein [Nodosilinea sp. LEGE 07088]